VIEQRTGAGQGIIIRMASIVALDIETTGLNYSDDAIIEIGAVCFNNRRIEGEWSTLINPGKRIPPFITKLTNITDQLVLHSPPIEEILPDLVEFIGGSPILGHNVQFDLSFLRRYGILTDNDPIDTYDLASVVLPSAGRYNLSALTQALKIPLSATHRALDDARATRGIYLRLFETAQNLPLYIIAELVRASEGIEWGAYLPFREILKQRSKEAIPADKITNPLQGPIFDETTLAVDAPLQGNENPSPINIEEASASIQHGGQFSKHFPEFEYRPEQVAMLDAVAEAISQSRHLLVEAGTGTGKSIAYLIPAALWAIQNDTRVVVSTNTINLQDQLINKDIPDITSALSIDLRASVLKGRANYLCPRRLENFRRHGPQNAEEMRVFGKILVWLNTSETGDRVEINLNGPIEREIWTRISADDEACTSETCKKRTGGICPYQRARQAALSSHLLVINHALLLVDIATGNRVLPEFKALIVDEAHHLEEATTNALSFRVTQRDIERLLRELGGTKTGVLGWLISAFNGLLKPGDFASLTQIVGQSTDLVFRLESLMRRFYDAIEQFISDQREGRPASSYSYQERIQDATRTQPSWTNVELAWEESQYTIQPLIDVVAKLLQATTENITLLDEEDEELYSSLSNIYRRLSEINIQLNALVFEPLSDQIYWVQIDQNRRRVSLHSAPLHIGQLMQKHIWYAKDAVILTSATLTAAGEFDYLRNRLYAEDAYELALGSPFDFESSTLLYIANDIPEPGDRRGHQRAVEMAVVKLCLATGGKTLVLFTSYDQLRRTSRSITPILAKDGIVVYEQGEGASPHALLDNFRSSEKAVLLGTRAFWEGVDIPGEALSVLVIVKLPFDVPSDPIVAARAETFEDPFYQFSLPEAILRFRQGFGRLIRTQQDRGVVVILDKRVLTKRYGPAFIESLPNCTYKHGPLINIAPAAVKWLNI
jgi:DNA polymerase-3 subunit epsilon/ATP-dependent DNA helicase DinG